MVNKKLFSNVFLIIFILWLVKLFFYALELKKISTYLSLSLIILIGSLIIISLFNIFRNFDKKKLIITTHYPSLNKFQYNSNLKNAKKFDSSVLNFFVKQGTPKKYINSVCNLFYNI